MVWPNNLDVSPEEDSQMALGVQRLVVGLLLCFTHRVISRSLSAASETPGTPAPPAPVLPAATAASKPAVPPIPKSMVKREPDEDMGAHPKVNKACAVKGGSFQEGRPPATPQQAMPKAVPKPVEHPPPKVPSPVHVTTTTAPPAAPMAAPPSAAQLCKLENSIRPSMSKRVQELRQRGGTPSQAPALVKPSMKVELTPAEQSSKGEPPRVEEPNSPCCPTSGHC